MKRTLTILVNDPKGLLQDVACDGIYYFKKEKQLGIKLRGGTLPEVPETALIPSIIVNMEN